MFFFNPNIINEEEDDDDTIITSSSLWVVKDKPKSNSFIDQLCGSNSSNIVTNTTSTIFQNNYNKNYVNRYCKRPCYMLNETITCI